MKLLFSDQRDNDTYQTECDYGRYIGKEIWPQNQKHFNLTLPENPYRVVMADYTPTPSNEFPDQPILQFWTWYSTLHLLPPNDDNDEGSTRRATSGLVRCDIADDMGDWCGSIVVDEDWLLREKSLAEVRQFCSTDTLLPKSIFHMIRSHLGILPHNPITNAPKNVQ